MSEFLSQFTDPYERKARLEPMLWALAPAFLLLLLYAPGSINFSVKSAVVIFLYGMISSLLSKIARNAGKRMEEPLKASWGGWPSMVIFRHLDSRIDPITKANIHRAMAKAVPGTTAPTSELEEREPTQCDVTYTAWSEHLRKFARREQKKFPHVFRANVTYGFWRNLFGLKAFAIWVLVLCLIISVSHAVYLWREEGQATPSDVVFSGGALFTLLLWRCGLRNKSVKEAADSYAQRLIDDCVPESKTRKKAA